MIYFFGIFSDIFAACGTILGGIIVAVLAVFIVVCCLFIGWLLFSLALATVYAALYYWPRMLYYRLRGVPAPPEPLAIWAGRKVREIHAWMKRAMVWLEKKEAQAKEKAETQKWKSS